MATRQKIIHTGNRGSEINALTEKTTPVDADMTGLMDSAASNVLKKLSWVNIKATLKSYFDTLYLPKANPYKFRVYRNAALNSETQAVTKLVFDTENFDTNNNFATGTYTCPVAGFYQFSARIQADHDGYLAIYLYKNGSRASDGAVDFYDTGYSSAVNLLDLTQCAAGDTIEIYYYIDGVKAFSVGSISCYFSGFLVCLS